MVRTADVKKRGSEINHIEYVSLTSCSLEKCVVYVVLGEGRRTVTYDVCDYIQVLQVRLANCYGLAVKSESIALQKFF